MAKEIQSSLTPFDWVYIHKSSIELALKTGKAEGKAEEKIEVTKLIVLNMAKKEFSFQIIFEITGLTKEEVELIIEKEDGK